MPNPVHDVLVLDEKANLDKIDFFTISGKLIKSFKAPRHQKLNLSELHQGVYIAVFTDVEGYQKAFRIVKE